MESMTDLQFVTTVVVAAANVFLVILTSVYVLLTRKMVLEIRNARGPSVYFDLELPEQEMRMAICNSGLSAAHNVAFQVNDKIPWRQSEDWQTGINSVEVIRSGISYLPAGRTLKYIAGFPEWEKVNDENALVKVIVSYDDEVGKHYRREYHIDVKQYRSVLFESFRDPSREVAQAIRDTDRRRETRETTRGMVLRGSATKTCPMCGEKILESAKKCSHCLEYIADTKNPTANDG